jgi:hypothetical protein
VRARLKIRWIMDNTKRKVALQRRLPNLQKQVRELAVLCDVPACLVVYCPGEARPVVWPSPEAASEVVRRYRGLPDSEKFKSQLDGIDLLEQRNDKVRAKLAKVQQQCHDKETELVLLDFLTGRRKSFDDLPADLVASVESRVQNKLQAIKLRLQELRSGATPTLSPQPPPTSVGTSPDSVNSSSTSK